MNRREFISILGSIFLSSNLINPIENILNPKKEIFLTIDDGPRKNMESFLFYPSLTFFLIGKKIKDKGYYLACKALELGHKVGNHSYSHPSFSKISLDQAKQEIEKTDQILEKVYNDSGIKRKKLFRFPYGDSGGVNYEQIRYFLNEMGYKTYRWTRDTDDWRYPLGKRSITDILNVISQTKNNDIVLMHDLPLTSKLILPYYRYHSEDYSFKTLN